MNNRIEERLMMYPEQVREHFRPVIEAQEQEAQDKEMQIMQAIAELGVLVTGGK